MPIVQGLTLRALGPVRKIAQLILKPKPSSWAAILQQIRETGDKTSGTTKRGANHPCQTGDLRCDHQGEIDGNYINTQVQLGGSITEVERTKPTQSTSVTQVNVHYQAYNSPLIKDALARAHDWSYATGFVAQIDPVAVARTTVVVATRPSAFTCNGCGKKYVAMDNIALGLALGGYPPRCTCGGTPTRG
jgi:hypothetical protein